MSREHDKGGIVIEVAAADHLMKVEADNERLREALRSIVEYRVPEHYPIGAFAIRGVLAHIAEEALAS